MDNQRLLLFIALSFIVLLLWEAWQRDYGTHPAPTATQVEAPATPGAAAPSPSDVPTAAPPAPPAATATAAAPAVDQDTSPRIHVETDQLKLEIDTRGGDLRKVDLLGYPVAVNKPNQPVRLLNDVPPDIFIAQSGLRTPDGTEPTHYVVFHAAQQDYRLAPGQDELVVPLTWTSPEGVKVIKRYRFHRGKFLVDLEQEVVNNTGKPWHGRQYRQLQRADDSADHKGYMSSRTYTGGVIYSPEEKYEKISFKDIDKDPLSRDIDNGWAAMIQHYFLAAWIPARDQVNHYYSKDLGNKLYVLGLVAPMVTVDPGQSHTFVSQIYMGPKLQERLEKIAKGLELTVDYGRLTVLAKPIYWLMEKIHGVVGNWGWSIILLTMFIKLLFYKPSEMSYRSMAQMRKLGPRLQALKERYSDDKQKLNQAMMELYRTEKINPLGGCLPILIQIPVFISLYWVLLESVELRQADFIFWIHDLSTKDPYYVLPLIMGVSMFLQQKLNPAPVDPIQAKVMSLLPIVFTVFFAFFPSGLVLYWVTNNVLSITQQWIITRRIERGGK